MKQTPADTSRRPQPIWVLRKKARQKELVLRLERLESQQLAACTAQAEQKEARERARARFDAWDACVGLKGSGLLPFVGECILTFPCWF